MHGRLTMQLTLTPQSVDKGYHRTRKTLELWHTEGIAEPDKNSCP